jgi:hypothetical protein
LALQSIQVDRSTRVDFGDREGERAEARRTDRSRRCDSLRARQRLASVGRTEHGHPILVEEKDHELAVRAHDGLDAGRLPIPPTGGVG